MLWMNDLVDVSLLTDGDLEAKLEQVLVCTRRSLDITRVTMHNSNYIDAETSFKQVKEFSDLALSLKTVIAKGRPAITETDKFKRLAIMTDCLARRVTSLDFDIKEAKKCHFECENKKSLDVNMKDKSMREWQIQAAHDYLSTRCQKCFKCRTNMGQIYGFWGKNWKGEWGNFYEPKVRTWKDYLWSGCKHGLVLGAQIAAFSAVYLTYTRDNN